MRLPSGEVAIVMADIAGKGIPTALLMGICTEAYRLNALWVSET